MKADKFVNALRTIIGEEVRKAVREEMRLILEESTTVTTEIPNTDLLRERFSKQIMASEDADFIPKPKKGKAPAPRVANINSILAETATSMHADPNASAFFEGLK